MLSSVVPLASHLATPRSLGRAATGRQAHHHPDPHFATTLAHGLAVLQAFTVAEPALNNKELTERTGLSKATIARLTYTLGLRGLVVFDARLRRLRLGSTALTIGYPLMASLQLRQQARARMRALAEEIGGSVSLGMRDRTQMVYVETTRGHDLSAWRPDIGAAIPMLPTAMGRGWLAAAEPTLRDEVLARIERDDAAQWQAQAGAFEAAVDELAAHGFCTSRGTWRADVHAVSVPLSRPLDGETLVFNCGVLTSRLKGRALEQRVGPRLVALVREVEEELWGAGARRAVAAVGGSARPARPASAPAARAVSARASTTAPTAVDAAAAVFDAAPADAVERPARDARPEPEERDAQYAQTLARGLDLLLCFWPGETRLANRDFSDRTGLSRPTVARLTHTLAMLGYLRHDRDAACYRLGAAVLGLAHPLLASLRIRPLARPLLEALAVDIGGAVSIGMRHRLGMVYVETARGTEALEVTPDIGAPLPILSTAMGLAWLASAEASERRSVLNQLHVVEAAVLAERLPAVELARAELERSGYCSARAEWQPNGHGFAVPLRSRGDETRFVVNCAVLADRGSFAQLQRDVAPRLVTLAHSLEVLMGLR